MVDRPVDVAAGRVAPDPVGAGQGLQHLAA